MILIYDHWTGSFNDVKASLIKSIAQYLRHYEGVKVGITSNPLNRFSKHNGSNKKWEKMIVKYETSSVKYINEMEKILINNFSDLLLNEVAGGGGPNGGSPYYLYVLIK
ncbi:hypothetical protein SY27_04010 [Flavobacterium sp. 316]|uniref:hypothetical protein n=1 Tax=Flavobacterium sp. 316 TaxID=1603293 RepID=UPI0005E6F16E|nr:hypothetical protein [Flavobacterium sp. 316]KIX21856.1 hypothetical protein SY27_04010 [Flavobacterium sp. 316]